MKNPIHHQAGRFKSCKRRIESIKAGIIGSAETRIPSAAIAPLPSFSAITESIIAITITATATVILRLHHLPLSLPPTVLMFDKEILMVYKEKSCLRFF